MDLQSLLPAEPNALAVVAGYASPNDGGGGIFVWRSDSTAKADGGTILGQAGRVSGRWHRVHDGPLNVQMFGAKGDGKADDTSAIQAAIDAAAGAELRIPAGKWLVTRTLRFRTPPGGHGPGLKLAGDGMMSTVLDCRVLDGPALSVEQTEGYHFGKGGFIRDMEFRGLNASSGREQHGIVLSGAWFYRFDRVLVEGFKGHGLLVPFMSDRGFRYSDVDIVAGSNIARRPKGDFNFTVASGETIVGDGIPPGTYVDQVPDGSVLQMTKPALRSGHVELNIFGRNPDGQTTSLFGQDCRFMGNGGWGIYGGIGVGFTLSLRDCEVGANATGGIRTDGILDMYGGGVGANGTNDGRGIGILLDSSTNSGTHRARLEAVEIDGNRDANLWLRRVRFVRVIRCRFQAAEFDKLGVQFPRVSVRIGDSDGSAARTVEFIQNMVRVDARHLWPHVGFEIPDGAEVDNLTVRDTFFWGGWSDAHHTKYRIGKLANQNARLRFDEEGRLSAGTSVPALYQARLRTPSEGRVEPGGAQIVRFTLVESNQPRLPASWPMSRMEALTTSEGSDEVRSDREISRQVAAGMPVLLYDDAVSLEAPNTPEIARVAAAPASRLMRLDRAAAVSRTRAAMVGGTICPFEGYFAVDLIVDVRGTAESQPIALTLLVDGKPWRTENTLIHGLPTGETARLSVVESWPSGTALHVLFRNTSKAPIAVVGAALNIRLLS